MSRHPSLPLLTNSHSSEGARRQSGDVYFLGLFKARRDLCSPSPAIISRCGSCAGLHLFSLLNRTEQRVWGDDLLEMHPGRDEAAGYCCLRDRASAGVWKMVHSTSGSAAPLLPGACPALPLHFRAVPSPAATSVQHFQAVPVPKSSLVWHWLLSQPRCHRCPHAAAWAANSLLFPHCGHLAGHTGSALRVKIVYWQQKPSLFPDRVVNNGSFLP